jgi:hypothetical protein
LSTSSYQFKHNIIYQNIKNSNRRSYIKFKHKIIYPSNIKIIYSSTSSYQFKHKIIYSSTSSYQFKHKIIYQFKHKIIYSSTRSYPSMELQKTSKIHNPSMARITNTGSYPNIKIIVQILHSQT